MASDYYGIPCVRLEEFEIPDAIISILPADVARARLIIPINVTASTVVVAVAEPSDEVVCMLRTFLGKDVEQVLADPETLRATIESRYPPSQS